MDNINKAKEEIQSHMPEKQDVDRFKHRLMRTKTIVSTASPDEESAPSLTEGGNLQQCLTTFDLISLGVGSCCGTGMYVVAGLVAKHVAGPSTMFSFIIAAIASILSGVCYAEFGVRVPKTSGSAYMYSYVTVGEFVAFLIGWNLILEYMIGSAASASALSACFDALMNHTMSAVLEENIGTVIGKSYPDFLGFFISLAMTAVLALGVRGSVRFNNIFNAINLAIWLLMIIVGLFYADTSNWTTYGFAPGGASGVFSGAATCFYAFIGFDIIATTGEEAKDPSRSIPIAIITSLIICLLTYITSTMVLTLMVPYFEIHGDSALIDMFVQVGAGGMKWVVVIGAVAALTVSLLGSMFPMPRVIYAMARDGLLFETLSLIHPKTGTPLAATVITGVFASFLSLLVGLRILVEMMSIGTLLAYTLVSLSVLILRYQPTAIEIATPMAHRLDIIDEEEKSKSQYDSSIPSYKLKDAEHLITPSDETKSYGSVPLDNSKIQSGVAYCIRHMKILWLTLGFPSDDSMPSNASAKTTIIFVGCMVASTFCTNLVLVFGEHHLEAGKWWAILLFLVFFSGIVASIVIIMRQPQNKKVLAFKAPGVPILPAFACFFNIYLMFKLPGLTWARLGIWICVGLLIYFSYSMFHSSKERKQRAKEQHDSGQQMNDQNNFDTDAGSIKDSTLSNGQTIISDHTNYDDNAFYPEKEKEIEETNFDSKDSEASWPNNHMNNNTNQDNSTYNYVNDNRMNNGENMRNRGNNNQDTERQGYQQERQSSQKLSNQSRSYSGNWENPYHEGGGY